MAVVTRTLEAQDDYRRTLDNWRSAAPSGRPLNPRESDTLSSIENAMASGNDANLRRWGGFAEARRIALPLLRRPDRRLLYTLRRPSRTRLAHALIVPNQRPNGDVTETTPPPSHRSSGFRHAIVACYLVLFPVVSLRIGVDPCGKAVTGYAVPSKSTITGALDGQVWSGSSARWARYSRSTKALSTESTTFSLPSESCSLDVGGCRGLNP